MTATRSHPSRRPATDPGARRGERQRDPVAAAHRDRPTRPSLLRSRAIAGRQPRPARADAPRRRARPALAATSPPVPTSSPPTRSRRPPSPNASTASTTRSLIHELNVTGARLARRAVDAACAADGRQRWVAGAIGPTNVTLSLSPKVEDPGYRAMTFRELAEAYRQQIAGARRGRRRRAAGRDDLRHAQRQGGDLGGAGSHAVRHRSRDAVDDLRHDHRPIRPHAVGSDRRRLLAVGSPRRSVDDRAQLRPRRSRDAALHRKSCRRSPTRWCAPTRTPACRTRSAATTRHRHRRRRPSASSPNAGFVNVVGGCCGTTPAHIAAIVDAVAGKPARRPAERRRTLQLSGLEQFTLTDDIAVRQRRRAHQRHRAPPSSAG